MSEAYIGLRRRRKRTHPSKCPCCINTDQEGEPENEASAGSENNHEVIKDIRPRKRKKTTKKKEDGSRSDSDSSELHSTATPTEKPPPKKRKLRNASEESPSQDINKDSDTKKAPKAVSSKNNSKNNKEKSKVEKTVEKSKTKKAVSSKNANTTNTKKDSKSTKKSSKTQLQDSDEDYKSDIETDLLASKVSRRKSSISNENDMKRKKPENTRKTKGSSQSRANGSTKKDFSNVDVSTSQESDNQTHRTAKGKPKKVVTKSLVKGKTPSRRTPIEKPSLAVTKPSQHKAKSSTASVMTQTKIMVFDDLYDKLKSSYGNKDLTIEEAAQILMNVSSESLYMALKPYIMTENVKEGLDMFSRNHSDRTQLERKQISDTEEIVSQAAEALVSFRSKSPLNREDNKTEKLASSSQRFRGTCSSPQDTLQSGEKPKLQTITAPFTSSQAVQALMQIQTPASFPSQVLPSTSVTAAVPQNILHGMLPGVCMPQSFPQMLPSTITTSFPNLMPMVSTHGTLPSFSQIAAHMRPPPMTGCVQPALLNAGLPNPNLPTASAMLANQALLQPQLQQPTPLPNPVTSSKPTLTTLTTMKTTTQPVEPTATKASTQAQNPLQQPLKGMEEVVGNVGSSIPPPFVLNIKSPVVFLGSPQNLGGVPRNLMATPGNQTTVNTEQSGYPPVAPKPVSKSDTLRMNPGSIPSVQNVLTLGGRPILPRTQVQTGDDCKRLQSIAPQSGMPQLPQHTMLSSCGPYPVMSSALVGQATLTQVSSANIKKPTLMVNIPAPSQVGPSLPNFIHHNIQESHALEGSSPSSVSAKLAVKKLVHERTKSAELKREASGTANPTSKLKAILPLPPKEPTVVPIVSATINHESGSKSNEFNLEQAATALLSIGVPDGIETIGLKQSSSAMFVKEDHEEDVVFTSKGTFRVGDVDVDPRFNRIGREGYTCGKCNKIFTSLSYLARHIKRVCPDMSCRKWKCTLCDKAFRHPFGLQQHVYTHTGERPHKCPLCPKAFYSSNDLRRHSRIHSGERPYRCKHCDKSFATTISLKTHTYIHTGEKPHKCPKCPKTFATSSKLGRHIVTHSEQRPFSCDQCPKSFNRSGDLRRHNLAVHDGKEKSFDCDLCPATFSKPAGLRRHNTTLHQKQPKTMECDDCGTQFSTPICLKMHRDTYHKNPSTTTTAETDKTFMCDICGKTYSSAALLTKHIAIHEPSSTAGYNPSQFQHIAPKPMEQTPGEAAS